MSSRLFCVFFWSLESCKTPFDVLFYHHITIYTILFCFMLIFFQNGISSSCGLDWLLLFLPSSSSNSLMMISVT